MKNSGVNVFGDIPVGKDESGLLDQFLGCHDFAPGTRRLIVHDVRQFADWFTSSNKEPFVVGRVLDIEYRCPDCDHEWQEQWSSACDSQCPNCGLKNITALSWSNAAE